MFGSVVVLLSLLSVEAAGGWDTGWDSEDLELFDVVEEVNQNFYELLGVEQVWRRHSDV